jgi:hypothetical protein
VIADIYFKYPTCVVIDSNNLYVADSGNDQIQILKINDDKLSFTRSFGKEKLQYPSDIVIYDNEIFINDLENLRILVYDKIKHMNLKIFECTTFSCYSMIVDQHFIFVTGSLNTIFKIDKKKLAIVDQIKVEVTKSKIGLRGIALENNELIVADYHNNKMLVIDKESGKLVRTITDDEFKRPSWLTVYKDEIYCSSCTNNKVCVFKRHYED